MADLSAADLLTYARLMHRAYRRRAPMPAGWRMIGARRPLIGGPDACAFTDGRRVVVAYKGIRPWSLWDLLAMLRRRVRGTYSRKVLRFAADMASRYGGKLVAIGHSGGGGVAAWVGHRLGCQTVSFNAGHAALRTKAARLNDGSRLTNVWIKGDYWGDGSRGRRPIKGTVHVLDCPPGRGRHWMGTIVEALNQRTQGIPSDDR